MRRYDDGDRSWSYKPRDAKDARKHQKLGKGKDSSLEPLGEIQPCQHLDVRLPDYRTMGN